MSPTAPPPSDHPMPPLSGGSGASNPQRDFRIRQAALKLAIEAKAPSDSVETFDRVVRYFERYLRTGKLGTDE